MLLEVSERLQINNLVDEVVEYFFQMDPNPILTQFIVWQVDKELGNHHVKVIIVRSDAHFNTIRTEISSSARFRLELWDLGLF